ncbi:YqfO family protein [Alkalimarinus coralli]|uniref:Nif3-like dinuclear metal center hexameric protein n=1 Tax=Alkalimarinus coralli TaxID=2935863 RepID=UPI00202ADCFE|nr:YqfO family protein [Alkalimarinus coralli]
MYKICFYVPESYLEIVKEAMFDAGGGRIGAYEKCCWQVSGEGQFKPMAGSSPFIGEVGSLERVSEFKVEMVCEKQSVKSVVLALRQAHPYEEPAFDVVECIQL